MTNGKMENSIRSLVTLYTVVIGAALTVAVTGVIDTTSGLLAATPTSICLFLAYIATLFPFVHGAIRHLDDAYLENPNGQIKDGALVVDFVLLFFHALAFLALALLMKKPNHFAWGLIAVLSIDVVWGFFVHFAASSRQANGTEFKWAVINVITVAVGVSYLVINDIFLADMNDPIKLAIPVFFVAIIRSIADYGFCHDFYFPHDAE